MYSKPHHDTTEFQQALRYGDENIDPTPLGGFFCNGEIAPLGVQGLDPSSTDKTTHLHGFTSVFAVLYDTRPTTDEEEAVASAEPPDLDSV